MRNFRAFVANDSRFLTTLCLGGGCLSIVFSSAMAAAACCAFLIEGPDALYSSSPTSRQTVKLFLWAGPDSSVSCRHINLFIKAIQSRRAMRSTLYWCVVLLYRASSLIRHIGVLFSGMHDVKPIKGKILKAFSIKAYLSTVPFWFF